MNVLQGLIRGKKYRNTGWVGKHNYICLDGNEIIYIDTNGLGHKAAGCLDYGDEWVEYEEPKAEEMTLEQVCKELGRNIKIVKE